MSGFGILLPLLCACLSGGLLALRYTRYDRREQGNKMRWRYMYRESLLLQRVKDTALSMRLLADFLRESQAGSYEQMIRETAMTALENTAEAMCRDCGACYMSRATPGRDAFYLSRMTKVLSQGNPVAKEDLPGYFLESCGQPEHYLSHLNEELSTLGDGVDWKRCYYESREAAAVQLEDFRRTLLELAEYGEKPADVTERYEAGLWRICRLQRVVPERLMVLEWESGRREIHMQLRCGYGKAMPVKGLMSDVSSYMGRNLHLADSSRRVVSEETGSIVLETEPRLRVGYGIAAVPGSESDISGDAALAVEIGESRFLLCLTDAAGTGRMAGHESLRCSELLRTLIQSGLSPVVAVKMLNALLLLRSSGARPLALEVHVIDLYRGRAECIKQGAPESFVWSGRQMTRLYPTDVPIGWADSLEPVVIRYRLQEGDRIFIVSDGFLEMLPGEDKEAAMELLIREAESDSPQQLADHMLAAALGDEPAPDDVTILVAELQKRRL